VERGLRTRYERVEDAALHLICASRRHSVLAAFFRAGRVAHPVMKPVLSLALCLATAAFAAEDFRYGQPPQSKRNAADYVPDLATLAQPRSSELREMVERFSQDKAGIEIMHPVPNSALQLRRLREFYQAWIAKLEAVPYDKLGVEGRIDWHLLRNELTHLDGLAARQQKRNAEMAPLLPFAEALAGLQEKRREYSRPDGKEVAAALAAAREQIDAARKALEAGLGDKPADGALRPGKIVALRAIGQLGDLGRQAEDWFNHYDNYDPEFGWWTREPYKKLKAAMNDYAKFLREKVVGAKPGEDEPIVGDPIGAEGLAGDLAREMIPYTPEELVAIAEKELAWCEAEWRKVARDLGLGDDWRAALEKMKQDYVAPGEQPQLIARMAYEAVDFITKRDLITVPPHMVDDWYMTMMSPERQK
jgi:Bacterial protein of unknown function (DUF885)